MDSPPKFLVIENSTYSSNEGTDCREDHSPGCTTPFYIEQHSEHGIELFKKVKELDESTSWKSLGQGQLFTRVVNKNFYYMCIRSNKKKEGSSEEWLLQEQIMPYSYLASAKEFRDSDNFTTSGLPLLGKHPKVNLHEYLLWMVDTTSTKHFLLRFNNSLKSKDYLQKGFTKYKLMMIKEMEEFQNTVVDDNSASIIKRKYWKKILDRTELSPSKLDSETLSTENDNFSPVIISPSPVQ